MHEKNSDTDIQPAATDGDRKLIELVKKIKAWGQALGLPKPASPAPIVSAAGDCCAGLSWAATARWIIWSNTRTAHPTTSAATRYAIGHFGPPAVLAKCSRK